MPDPLSLPPLFTTAEPESFAMKSIRDRHAAALLQVVEKNRMEEPDRSAVLAFREEALGGSLTDPFGQYAYDSGLFHPQEIADWKREIAPLEGRSWYDLPWYFAESFFFLKLLFAFGYYDPVGGNRLRDPFLPFKTEELSQPGGALEAAARIGQLQAEGLRPRDTLRKLLIASLWGNRMDLSLQSIARRFRGSFLHHESRELLIDHSRELAERLLAARRVDMILDNSGSELACDLLLAGYLLRQDRSRQVTLHAKHAPFYVSDATVQDVLSTVQSLVQDAPAQVREVGWLLSEGIRTGRLEIHDHWFWNGPLFFTEMPEGLARELSGADLVLIKGDASYRRLATDRKWEHTMSLRTLTGYFPAPFAVLRTLKSELVLDLRPRQVRRLEREDPEWRTNGRRGMILLVS